MGTRKPKMASSIRKIREIFLKDWDPVGVGNIAGAEDEYDAYIMPVYDLLRGPRSEQAIINYLRWAETVRMEITPPAKRLKTVAKVLLEIDVSEDEIQQ